MFLRLFGLLTLLVSEQSFAKHCTPIREIRDFENPVEEVAQSRLEWDRLEPKGTPRANIFVLPGTGGSMIPDDWTAKSLCRRGFRPLVIQKFGHRKDKEMNWTRMKRQLNLSIFSMQKIMDEYPGVRFGLFGTSLGGIYGATLAGLDSRIEAVVLIAGGGDLASILSYSKEKSVVKFRDALMQRYNVATPEALEAELRQNIPIDPLTVANPHRGVKMLMVINTFDTSVPTDNQKALWDAWNQPKRVRFPLEHISGISAAHVLKHRRMVKFLDRAFP